MHRPNLVLEVEMTKMIDLLGKKFGRLTVVSRGENTASGGATWNCECECGGYVPGIYRGNLLSGHTKSCGCLKLELFVERLTTHGKSGSKEHKAWKGIWDRCTNENAENYHLYGGRGISVAPEWRTFEQFYADMGDAPTPSHSVDRADNDGPYAAWNCYWATKTEQANNRRSNRMVSFGGVTESVADCCRRVGMPHLVVNQRLFRGWDVERAFTQPVGKPRSAS